MKATFQSQLKTIAIAIKRSLLLVLLSANLCSAATQEKPGDDVRLMLQQAIDNAGDSFYDKFDAEVWLVEQSQRLAKAAKHIPENERLTILRLVHREATKFKLDPMLVLALIDVESDFDQFAISSAGARGLMQVMPFWKDTLGKPEDSLFDIATNLRYGCAILTIYLKREKNNTTLALARYNGSRGQSWYPMRVYKSMRRIWQP